MNLSYVFTVLLAVIVAADVTARSAVAAVNLWRHRAELRKLIRQLLRG